ncbi:hypothetical protein, partial [Pseudomonas sp.]|uniref:hypothetical protein n=1 Tax=Pseudomonas sp. TaxID=306 RepID=UPI003CC56C2D
HTASTRGGWFENGKGLLQDLILAERYNASTWQYIFKKSLCKKFAVRFSGRAHEDHWFSMNVYLYSGKTFSVQDNLYFQRERKGSLTQSAKDAAYVLGGYDAYRETLGALKAHVNGFIRGKDVALAFMERNVSATVVKCLKNNVRLPDHFFRLTRADASECGAAVHGRIPVLLPELFFFFKKVRFSVRMFFRGLRKA